MPKARPELFSLTQDKLSKCRTFRETTFFLMRTLNEPNLESRPHLFLFLKYQSREGYSNLGLTFAYVKQMLCKSS